MTAATGRRALRRRPGHVSRLAALAYAAVDLAVILAPALVLRASAARRGMAEAEGLDLVVASAVIGLAHGAVAGWRLQREAAVAARRADVWIAAVNALVVLAVGATVLLVAVLVGFADQHAAMARRGYPVAALWVGVQIAAVTLAEVSGRCVFRWLERGATRTATARRPAPRPAPRGLGVGAPAGLVAAGAPATVAALSRVEVPAAPRPRR